MKILLIGASGCFGNEFSKVCKRDKIKLISYPSKKLDITKFKDLNSKIKKIKPTIVVNSSAIVGINQCETNFNKAFEINTIGALNLAKICKSNNLILVQTSTHAVFDGTKNSSYNEKDIPKPNNVYSGSKYLSEVFVKSICKKYNIPTAKFLVCKNKIELRNSINKFNLPVVVKADGLAAGKGVVICKTKKRAIEVSKEIFKGKFKSSKKVLLEENSKFIIDEAIDGVDAEKKIKSNNEYCTKSA